MRNFPSRAEASILLIICMGVTLMTATLTACSQGLEEVHMEDRPLDKPLPINTRPRIMAIGQGFSVGIKKDGSVWTWGRNFQDILGRPIGRTEEGYVPGLVPGLKDAVSVVADDCIILLMKDGTVWSWGENDHGQLGYATEKKYSGTPRQIPGLTDVIDIATSAGGSQALKKDGTVWGWGSGEAGLLGASVEKTKNNIRQISGLHNIARIEMRHAIDRSGRLWIYGIDPVLAGRNVSAALTLMPGIAAIPTPVVDVSVRSDAAYALLENGEIWSWGYNNGGQLGSGEKPEKKYALPKRIHSLSRVILIASNLGATVVTENGILATWGVSASAPPGPSPFPRHDLNAPYKIKNKMKFPIRYVVGGMSAYAAIDDVGEVWYWRDNSRGQRGTGLIVRNPDEKYWTTPEKSLWVYN